MRRCGEELSECLMLNATHKSECQCDDEQKKPSVQCVKLLNEYFS
jgi:hypothetical protein